MDHLKIALVSSEVVPFAKSGGLADVSAALARHLARAGHEVMLLMPLHRCVREGNFPLEPDPDLSRISLEVGGREFSFRVVRTPLPDSDLSLHLIDCPELFDRDGVYTSDADEPLRFAFFSLAALKTCQWSGFAPDVVHCNDWHTSLLPLYLRAAYGWDELFKATKTVLTIHNIGYQGVFGDEAVPLLGLDPYRELLYQEDLHAGRLNFLKTGIQYADALTTVSETYAHEIQTPEYGAGLHDFLKERSRVLFGIVNGIDYEEWNPESDSFLKAPYSVDDLAGKADNKAYLLESLELSLPPGDLLFGVVSRLTAQKGFELLPDILPVLLQRGGIGLAILGSGDRRYVEYFRWLQEAFPDRVVFYDGFNEELAHLIEAASDAFLMPSRYEPCGLNQMYSLRYGTVPVVRRTGGLADTVRPYDPETGSGTGFTFDDFRPEALLEAMERCIDLWQRPDDWRRLMQAGMREDFSWKRQVRHYIELYAKLSGSGGE